MCHNQLKYFNAGFLHSKREYRLTQVTFKSTPPPQKKKNLLKCLCECVCMCVCKQTHFKGCTKKTQNPQKTTKKQALNSTIAFPTMVSEPGKLESTMMHRAHNGLTNCSFVSENTPLFYRKHYSVSAITLPGRHAVTDYA